jgi:hypothetical protein
VGFCALVQPQVGYVPGGNQQAVRSLIWDAPLVFVLQQVLPFCLYGKREGIIWFFKGYHGRKVVLSEKMNLLLRKLFFIPFCAISRVQM